MKYYLAIDIGASSGRHMLAHMEEGKIVLEEIHRFPNGMEPKGEELCWNMDQLFGEILVGMKKCKELNKIPVSVGIDTWGVDFVLLDGNDKVIGNTVGYRDKRTEGMDEKVYSIISQDKLYERTGIQKQIFNTIYQLMALKEKKQDDLAKAESLLLVPDYLHFLLSGEKRTEYTNATTTQLINPTTKQWDFELIEMLGYPKKIFKEISVPGTTLGMLKDEIVKEVGFNCQVTLPATHDTGSAVVAVPSWEEDTLYISSGTWSLMGIERKEPDCSLGSMKRNFTNEGGYQYRFRYLKNIMGLWMIQSVKKEFEEELSYAEICERASKETIAALVDCNDERFLAPESMIKEVQKYCEETRQEVPQTESQIASVIYNSLAVCYDKAAKELEEVNGNQYDAIHIVGGGANAAYLNELTAKYTGKKVFAGPVEATAIGNIAVQMLAEKELTDLKQARAVIFDSFEVKAY